jgi:AraC-like DNA-binding protein
MDTDASTDHDLGSALQGVAALLDYIRWVSFFAKDSSGRFIAANRNFLKLCGVRRLDDLLGRSDRDFFEPARARLYMEDDRKVFATGRPVESRIEPEPLVGPLPGADLIVTNKMPVRLGDGRIGAVAGVCLHLADAAMFSAELGGFAALLRRMEETPGAAWDLSELAASQGMSVSKFERQFKRLFFMTPAAYRQSLRLRRARHDLITTRKPVGQIAIEQGFYDQSHFTKRFRAAFGCSPLRCRREAEQR